MMLLDEIAKLRELEQTGMKNVLSWQMLDLAPPMLEVLGCFREGDAKLLDRLVYEETDMAKFRAGFGKISDREQDMIDMLKRLQKAANLVEQEREG